MATKHCKSLFSSKPLASHVEQSLQPHQIMFLKLTADWLVSLMQWKKLTADWSVSLMLWPKLAADWLVGLMLWPKLTADWLVSLVSWFDAVTKADRWLACQFISHDWVISHCLLWWISTCGQWKKKLPLSDHSYKKGNKRGEVLHGKLPSKDLDADRLLFSYQELKTSITN